MAIPIFTHKVLSGKIEPVNRLVYTGTSIVLGSIVVWSTSNIDVAGADPTEIVGVALEAYNTHPGFDAANSPATFTGRSATVSVSRPNNGVIYAANLTTSSSTLVVPAQANVGQQYGITAYSGKWTVDTGKTGGSARVETIGFDTSVYGGIILFTFLPSFLSNN